MFNILIIIGTRPELIKLAPVVYELKKKKLTFKIVNTAQHRDLLDPYWKLFNIKPDYNLDVMQPNQNLSSMTARLITQLQKLIEDIKFTQGIILAQGDTTTVMVSSMIAFYNRLKFAHVEAGLRSFDFENPFPEEYNRIIASVSTSIHFAPTELARINLLKEGVLKKKIHVSGNTIVDAVKLITSKKTFSKSKFENPIFKKLEKGKTILITCHRRENHGSGIQSIIQSVLELSKKYKFYQFVWVLHPNPNVKNIVLSSQLIKCENVSIVNPLDYIEIIKLINLSKFIITDSGGIQEEAPSFKIPVIILRETTERPEGVNLGIAKLCGVNKRKILHAANWADNFRFTKINNPYGDGKASIRIVKVLERVLKNNL